MNLAFAHDGPHGPAAVSLSTAWTLDPLVAVPLLLAAWLYWKGARSSWQRAGVGRGVKRGEAAAFAGGMVALFFALVWPLDVLGEALFSAHMAQHLVLMNLAAPLLVLGAPLQVMIRALALPWRRAAARFVQRPAWRGPWRWVSGALLATVLQQVVLWGWHTPRGVAAALRSDALHIAMHASLLVAALLFWTAVLRPRSGGYWVSLAALLATLKLTGVVCIVLLLQPAALYTAYGDLAAAWGLAPIEDEQLGWSLMMAAGMLSYLGAAIGLFAQWLRTVERGHLAAVRSSQ